MRAFCRIVERGSIARAAEDLAVSPGLLSRELKLLETSLGCSLLSRTTRRMSLTGHGKIYYEDARQILDALARAEERVRAGAGVVGGLLRVNAPHSFGTTVLSATLPQFLARYPEVQLSLSFDDHVVDMIEGGFDLSIRIRAELPDSGIVARRIGVVRQGLFAAPAYLEIRGSPTSPEELHAHDLVAYALSDSPGSWILRGTERTEAVEISPRLRLGSSVVLRDMLFAGQGIGALPDFLSTSAVEAGRLMRVLPGWEMPERTIYAVTASRLGADAKTLAFIDFLRGIVSPHS
jgi:DNA-binding transcriptional LysR family regulator